MAESNYDTIQEHDNANLTEGNVTVYGMLMLAVFICTLPTALVFFILQKNFAEGITGAVK